MKQKRYSENGIFTRQLTSTVSVTLVLLILGLIAVLASGTRAVTDFIRSEVGFMVVMSDNLSADEARDVYTALASAPYVASAKFSTADENAAQWSADIGEDIVEVLGVNPFGATLEIRVHDAYATVDSLQPVVEAIKTLNGVDAVELNTELINGINTNLNLLSLILGAVALALLLVSFVLINNTVWLTVYSRRFLIHTMKLVGATGAFIRRPFIKSGIMAGVLAGVAASVLLALLVELLHSVYPVTAQFTSWSSTVWIFPVLILTGVMICGLASAIATNRYLRLDYDNMI